MNLFVEYSWLAKTIGRKLKWSAVVYCNDQWPCVAAAVLTK